MEKAERMDVFMKKKVLALALAAALALASMAMAGTEADGDVPEDDTAAAVVQMAPQGEPAYVRHDGVITDVADTGLELDTGGELPDTVTFADGMVVLTASGDTADLPALEPGLRVSVFVDGSAAVPLIYPPTYPASYVVIGDGENYAGVDIDVYETSDSLGMYLNRAKTLAVNVGEDTEIIPAADGDTADHTGLSGRKLAVFYDIVTMSLPPIANPARVVVLDGAAPEEQEYKITADGEDVFVNEDGVQMLPVRKYAEGLGFEVVWNNGDRSVSIGTVPMGVWFRIGENSYTKARMTPFELECAPVLIESRTFVPVSFFEEVLEAAVEIA